MRVQCIRVKTYELAGMYIASFSARDRVPLPLIRCLLHAVCRVLQGTVYQNELWFGFRNGELLHSNHTSVGMDCAFDGRRDRVWRISDVH
jgi:hypothetical protein